MVLPVSLKITVLYVTFSLPPLFMNPCCDGRITFRKMLPIQFHFLRFIIIVIIFMSPLKQYWQKKTLWFCGKTFVLRLTRLTSVLVSIFSTLQKSIPLVTPFYARTILVARFSHDVEFFKRLQEYVNKSSPHSKCMKQFQIWFIKRYSRRSLI